MGHRWIVGWALACAQVSAGVVWADQPRWMVLGRNGAVASDSSYASEAGVEILRARGNAIDAAVAVSFALGVTRPYSTGLGGGGFMIIRSADGAVTVLDYRETAPAAATKDMFLSSAGEGASKKWNPSLYGHRAVAVPGLLAGMDEALKQFGSMPLERLMAPAIKLARGGYAVDEHYVRQTRDVLEVYEEHPGLRDRCSYVYRTHLREGRPRAVGEQLVQPALARLLEEIGKHGAGFFYGGPVAMGVGREMRGHGGIITEADLAGYSVRQRAPIRSAFRGYEVITMPPPSSGGIALVEALNILETFDLAALHRGDAVRAMHYQIEAMKHAFADRARWLGDSDFVSVPQSFLTSKLHARRLASRISDSARGGLDWYGAASLPNDAGTSHFCVVDRFGNYVVATETINTEFGSLVAVEEWGLILNNEMDDFVSRPGEPNVYGLIQADRNAIAPGKRPLSSMTPTIVLKDGAPHLLIGASGGPRIISSVLNVLVGIAEYGWSLEEAMRALRPHHQWRPDQVYFDSDPSEGVGQRLARFGHRMATRRKTGVVQAIMKTPGGWLAASDPRKRGRPAGY